MRTRLLVESAAESTRIVGPSPLDLDTASPLDILLHHFAAFIWASSLSIKAPYFFILRGNCKKGLLRHLGMSPKMYSALLLALEWMTFRSDVGACFTPTCVARDLVSKPEHNLQGPASKPNIGVSEFLHVQVLASACKYHNGNIKNPSKKISTYALRIGAYGDGDSRAIIRAADEINQGGEPPEFCTNLRTHQRRFIFAIKHLLEPYYEDKRLPEVERWVNIDDLAENTLPITTSPNPKPNPYSNTFLVSPSPTQHTPRTHHDSVDEHTHYAEACEDACDGEVEFSVADDVSYRGGFDGDETALEPEENCKMEEFPLLSRLNLAMFGASKNVNSMSSFDMCRVNRDNVLRELVQLKGKMDEPLQFESLNSRTVSKLLHRPPS